MTKTERISLLKTILNTEHVLFIEKIIEKTSISEPTARRDINFLLTDSNIYTRVPNGIAIRNSKANIESFIDKKLNYQIENKQKIARTCIDLIKDYPMLLLDSGSTCYCVAQLMNNITAQVISTDIQISFALSKYENIVVHSIGGTLRHGHYTLLGDLAIQNLQKFHVPIAIISADTFDIDYGISNIHILEVVSKQEIRKMCDRLVVLLDSSKLNKKSFYKVLPVDDIDTIITDNNISPETALKIKEKGVELIIAKS